MTPEQISRGLTWDGEWPPTLPEFRAMCLGEKTGPNEYGLDYVPEYYRSAPILDKSRLLSSDERNDRRSKMAERMAALKIELSGKKVEVENEIRQ